MSEAQHYALVGVLVGYGMGVNLADSEYVEVKKPEPHQDTRSDEPQSDEPDSDSSSQESDSPSQVKNDSERKHSSTES